MNASIVYSSEHGRMCPDCGQPAKQCKCREKASAPANDGTVRVARQTKGRKGKGVTVISGLGLDSATLKSLAKQLKAKCGSGGTVKNGEIEIQGDHRDFLVDELKRQGWKAKRAGG